MKKVGLLGIIVVLALGLLVPMSAPVLACNPNTVASIEASPMQVPSTGGEVVLTITEANTGDVYIADAEVVLTASSLVLPLPLTLDNTSAAYGFWSSLNDGDAILDVGETWGWTVTVTVTEETMFEVNGYGLGDGYIVVSYPDFVLERDSVTVTVTPNGGDGEGCTPGYWKNPRRVWEGYDREDNFYNIFGAGPSITLEQALRLRGKDHPCAALIRHGTAALLNAAHPCVDYPIATVEGVIAIVVDGLTTTDCESAKNELADYNELGCKFDGCP